MSSRIIPSRLLASACVTHSEFSDSLHDFLSVVLPGSQANKICLLPFPAIDLLTPMCFAFDGQVVTERSTVPVTPGRARVPEGAGLDRVDLQRFGQLLDSQEHVERFAGNAIDQVLKI
eukprot:764658-Hanusia_phi.AAC.7